MARFMVKTSEYKNVCKAVNDRKLAELKKEIIEILKKQDEKEFKKAVDLFESQEMHYSHLEKSITGLKRPAMVLVQSVSGKERNTRKLLLANGLEFLIKKVVEPILPLVN